MFIDPRHLEQIAVIVEVGTLHKAASRLGTSQPALSRMISTLEARIGMALFERSTRPLTPTEIGLELARQGRTIQNARLRAVETVDLSARGFFGVLKVGAPPFLCKSLMSEAISGFMKERPMIRVNLVADYRHGLLERMQQNQIDVVIGPSNFVDTGDSDFIVETIFRDELALVGRKDHPLMGTRNVTVEDLDDVTWVGLPERSNLRLDMARVLTRLGVRNPLIALQSESAGAVLELLSRTDFLTVLPAYAVSPDGSDGLNIVDLKIPDVEQRVSAITLAQRAESKLISDFKRFLRDSVSDRYSRRGA